MILNLVRVTDTSGKVTGTKGKVTYQALTDDEEGKAKPRRPISTPRTSPW